MANTPISKLPVAAGLDGDEPLIVSQRSSTVTISAATISAAASDNSFNDSGGGFIAAGFAVGDYVNVSGFTGDTANNLYSGEITALTASKMTIGGTDGDVIVDDAAGETVVISKWVSRRLSVDSLSGGSGGTPSGTSFPGSPASGDKFYRSDRNIEYFYDGTRWLSTTLYTHSIATQDTGGIMTITGASIALRSSVPGFGAHSIYIEKLDVTMWNAAANTTTSYYSAQLITIAGAAAVTNVGSPLSGQGDVSGNFVRHTGTINAVIPTTAVTLNLLLTRTGTPTAYVTALVSFRLIG